MKKSQHYGNHTRYYVPHHFIFYPASLLLLIYSITNLINRSDRREEWALISCLCLLLIWLSYMLRQHYALTLQNRVVRLEMRLRYYQLTDSDFLPLEQQMSFGQIAALRFASDQELLPLIRKTLEEKLSPDAIKRSIKDWQPDEARV